MKKLLASTFVLATLLAGCDQATNPAGPAETLLPPPLPASPVVTLPTINVGDMYVCAEGFAGTYDFTASIVGGDVVFTGAVTAGAFSVANDACVLIANATQVGQVQVTLTGVPAGSVFSESQSYSVSAPAQSGIPISDGPATTDNPVTSPNFGEDNGRLIIFRSVEDVVVVGCSLTQGYWKTHAEDWDEDADANSALFLSGTLFYNSGLTYLEIMNTPPKGGNAYLQLAHQFIAASLNVGSPAATTAEVDAALTGADAFFAAAAAGTPAPTGAVQTQVQGWAITLASYNEGDIGPGHCPE